MKDLKTLAIEAALRQDWDIAIKINKNLLKEGPNDIETLNRLAFALMEKGDLIGAKKGYKKILGLDHFNPIALKNLNKLANIRSRTFKKKLKSDIANLFSQKKTSLPSLFLEEIGKTKVVKLKNLAELHIISQLKPGDEVVLSIKRRGISILDKNNTYLGALPDDLAHRLIQFMKHDNQYQAFVKSVDKNYLTIFIKEIERGSRFKNQPSFTNAPLTYLTSVRDEVFEDQEKPLVKSLEEEGEEELEEVEEEENQ